MRRPSGGPLLRDRQRDPGLDRPLARRAQVERFLERLYRRRESARIRSARHLRQLPVDRVPRAAVRRLRLLQRLPRVPDEPLEAYLARLQNLAGDRPLLIAEIGLDSRAQRRAEPGAGRSSWQLRTSFRRRAAPARSSSPGRTSGTAAAATIDDWDFGLTRPRPPAEAGPRRGARRLRATCPFAPRSRRGPGVSVVVCTYNGARTIRTLPGRAATRSTTRTTR